MDSRLPLDQLTEDERRGALIALDHVRRRGLQMERNAKASRGWPHHQRLLLATAGQAVRNTAHGVRRQLTPELKPHDYLD